MIDIENYRIDQKKQDRLEATWKPIVRMLKQMLTLTDLTDPEAVKLFLSDETRCHWAATTKLKAVDIYGIFQIQEDSMGSAKIHKD